MLDEYKIHKSDQSFFSQLIGDDTCKEKIENKIKELSPRNLDEGLGRKKRKSVRKTRSKSKRNKRKSRR